MAVADAKKRPNLAPKVNIGGKWLAPIIAKDNRGVPVRQVQTGAQTVGFVRTDTGERYTPDLKGDRMGLGKSLKKALKKTTSVVTQTAAGFATGGSVGALAGATRGVIRNTRTGRADTINLRNVGQAAVTGGVANIAAGAVAAGGKALAAGGVKSIIPKAIGWGKSGGLVGNAGNIFKTVGGYAAKGIPAFQALFAKGRVPGTSETVETIARDDGDLSDKIRAGYNTWRNHPSFANIADQIRDKAVGEAENYGGRFFGRSDDAGQVPGQPVVVNAPAGENNVVPLLAGLGIIAFLALKKK